MSAAAPVSLTSPCVGLCRIDDASSLCLGCARTREEIAGWRTLSAAARKNIWAALPSRREVLGIELHRLPWTEAEVRNFIMRTLAPLPGGTWVFGVPGAIAEFTIDIGEASAIADTASTITVATPRGAVRFDDLGRIRVLVIGREANVETARAIALVIPRENVRLSICRTLTALGPDRDAIGAENRPFTLYDLGLGTAVARFCVRAANPELRQLLDHAQSMPWRDVLAWIGPALLASSPHRVVVSAIGRVEVFTPIPPPSGSSPSGPHTHFLPATLATGHEAPPDLGIPKAYAVGALFYPSRISPPGEH